MSPTPHQTLALCRVGVAGAAAVVLLTGCGGGDSPTSRPADAAADAATDAGQSTAAAGDGDFCTQAAGIDERVDSALADSQDGDASVVDAFRQITVELRAIEAPAEITASWTAMADGLDRMADAFAEFDITDSDSLSRLEQAEGNLTEASTHVDKYLHDTCGIDSNPN